MVGQQTLDLSAEVRILLPQPEGDIVALSSRGLGHRPLTAETRVRIPLGLPHNRKPALAGVFVCGDEWKTRDRLKPQGIRFNYGQQLAMTPVLQAHFSERSLICRALCRGFAVFRLQFGR